MSRTTTKARGGGLPGSVTAEWTKLFSLRSTWWQLLASVLLMAIATYQAAANHPGSSSGRPIDVGEPAVTAVVVVMLLVVSLAMSVVTSEYATGSIGTTLLAVPVRRRVVLAKAVVVAFTTTVLATALTVVGVTVATTALSVPSRFDLSSVLFTGVVITCYLVVASLFTLGVALVIRSAVGTLVVTALLLLGLPAALGDSFTPGGSGLSFLTGGSTALGPAASLVLFGCWSVAAVALGHQVLAKRDG
jgi:ABC-2 type transport system permease protein